MVDLALSDDEKEIRSWVRTFVTKELLPLEPDVLARERRGERGLPVEELRRLQDVAKQAGFFGIQTPEAYGGMGLSAVMTALVEIELGRSFLQFAFAGTPTTSCTTRTRPSRRHTCVRRSPVSGSRASRSPSPARGRTRGPSGPAPAVTAMNG